MSEVERVGQFMHASILSTPRPQALPAFFSDAGSGVIEEELGGLDDDEDTFSSREPKTLGSLPEFFAGDGNFLLDDVLEEVPGEDGFENGYSAGKHPLDHETEHELPNSVYDLVLDEDDAEEFPIGSQYDMHGRSRGKSDADSLPAGPYAATLSTSVGRDGQSIWASAVAPTTGSPSLGHDWAASPGRPPMRSSFSEVRESSPGFSSIEDEVILPRPRSKDSLKTSGSSGSGSGGNFAAMLHQFAEGAQQQQRPPQSGGSFHRDDLQSPSPPLYVRQQQQQQAYADQQQQQQQQHAMQYGAYPPDHRPQSGGYYGEPQLMQRQGYQPQHQQQQQQFQQRQQAEDSNSPLLKLFGSQQQQQGPTVPLPNGIPRAPKVMSLEEVEARMKAGASQSQNLPVSRATPSPPVPGSLPLPVPLPVPLPSPSPGAMQAQMPPSPGGNFAARPPMPPQMMGHPHMPPPPQPHFMPPMGPPHMPPPQQMMQGPTPPGGPQHHWIPPGHQGPPLPMGMLPLPMQPQMGPPPSFPQPQPPSPFRGPPQMMPPNGRPYPPPQQQQQQQRGFDPRGPPPPFHFQQQQQQQQHFRPPSAQQQQQRSRQPTRESKARMSADEIEQILRMQEYQLTSQASNLFAEDYYCQTYLARKNHSQPDSRGGRSEYVLAHHKPLVESHPRPTFRRQGADPFEGALGRIPAHSVRAPRALLQLKPLEPSEFDNVNDVNTASSKEIHSLLLSIEQSYNLLLDIEDIDNILRSADQSSANVNVNHLRQKREEIVSDLYASLHVHNVTSVPHIDPRAPEPIAYLHPEDGIFTTLSVVAKGRKLLVRALPLFNQPQLLPILLQYLRNLSILVASTRLGKESSSSSKLFGYINQLISIGSLPQTILTLQTVLGAHTNDQLLKILRSKLGCSVIQAVLQRAHDLNLSPFSREDAAPAHLDVSNPLATFGYPWKDAVQSLVGRLRGRFAQLCMPDSTKVWEFFAVLVVNINERDKNSVLDEIREPIATLPRTPIIAAFLELAAQTNSSSGVAVSSGATAV